jgi:hypothetical protein
MSSTGKGQCSANVHPLPNNSQRPEQNPRFQDADSRGSQADKVLYEHIRSPDRSKNCGSDKLWEAGRTTWLVRRRRSELLLPAGRTARLPQNSIVMLKSRGRWSVRLMFYYAFDGVSLGGYRYLYEISTISLTLHQSHSDLSKQLHRVSKLNLSLHNLVD